MAVLIRMLILSPRRAGAGPRGLERPSHLLSGAPQLYELLLYFDLLWSIQHFSIKIKSFLSFNNFFSKIKSFLSFDNSCLNCKSQKDLIISGLYDLDDRGLEVFCTFPSQFQDHPADIHRFSQESWVFQEIKLPDITIGVEVTVQPPSDPNKNRLADKYLPRLLS